MNKTIRLTESELKKLIKESLDMAGFPYTGDYRARNKWWQDKMNNDFPGKRSDGTDYQKAYMEFYDEAEKNRIAKEKEDAKVQKKAATAQRNAEKRENEKIRRKEARMKERENNGGFPSSGTVTLDKNEGIVFYAEVDREDCDISWIQGYKPQHRGDDFEPIRQGIIDIEVYQDGTWLPDTNMKNIPGSVYKLFKKLGMREEPTDDLEEAVTRAIRKYLK